MTRVDDLLRWRTLLAEACRTDDYAVLTRLNRQARKLVELPDVAATLVPVRIGIVASATADLMLPVLEVSLLQAGLRPVFHVTPYGQVIESLIADDGELARFRPQITLVQIASAHVPVRPALGDPPDVVRAKVDEALRGILGPCEGFRARTGSEIVIDNFHPMPWRAAGNAGARQPGDATTFVRRLNLELADCAPGSVHINDVASLAERHGLDRWFDERYWYLAKQPVSFDCLPHYCRHVASIVGAVLGRSRKCLIVDLDNTLWGGVIGDDGLGGIEVGEGSAAGEAFRALQGYLRELKDRGVLLAVCSKNEEAIAKTPFVEHPDMVLRLDDFVAFKANWQPKSENIRAIAQELNLGLDAFAFLDDNPAERAEVSQALPEVAVPDMPDDPSGMLRALDRARLFETAAVSAEDRDRTAAYHALRASRESASETTDLPAFLRSLDMTADVEPFRQRAFERITQLINKTNQFNLTTPRVVPAEVERLASDPSVVTCTVRLRDRFADHGLISVAWGRVDAGQLRIEAWLMSCRVLGRGVERLVHNYFLDQARAIGLTRVVGEYRPTSRNELVRDHYSSLGFTSDARDGRDEWCLAVESAQPAGEVFIALANQPVS